MNYTTPNGKEIATYYDGRNLRVKFTTGGELPESLSGIFTNSVHANNAILKYIADFAPKAKTKSE